MDLFLKIIRSAFSRFKNSGNTLNIHGEKTMDLDEAAASELSF